MSHTLVQHSFSSSKITALLPCLLLEEFFHVQECEDMIHECNCDGYMMTIIKQQQQTDHSGGSSSNSYLPCSFQDYIFGEKLVRLNPSAVARGLRAVRTVLRTSSCLDRQQRTLLHLPPCVRMLVDLSLLQFAQLLLQHKNIVIRCFQSRTHKRRANKRKNRTP